MIKYSFASKNQASQLLGNRDEFIENLSPLDLQVSQSRSKEDYLRKLPDNALEFSTSEQALLSSEMNLINSKLENLGLNIDLEIFLVKTIGSESFGMPYTRQNFIVYTNQVMSSKSQITDFGVGLLAHEVFHIISRQNVQIRDELYSLHNFVFSPPTTLPPNRITNPDAPNADYIVRTSQGDVRPILALKSFSPMEMMMADKQLLLNDNLITQDQTNYLEVVKPNSKKSTYHPEEVSAENFRLLIEGKKFSNEIEFLNILKKYF